MGGISDLEATPYVDRLCARARAVLPGGVTSGSREHAALGRPLYLRAGRGSRVTDVDGNVFIDFTGGSGASMLGHAHPAVDEAVGRAVSAGTLCTAETESQVVLAERLCQLIPSAEKVRFTSSGTEATQVAVRVARAATGKTKILRFAGHYHGMHDAVLTGWTSSPDSAGRAPADSLGIPAAVTDLTVSVPFNDAAALLRAFEAHVEDLAAVIVEPISYNLGCVPADAEWLRLLRHETRTRGIVLIFDEILSGFRMRIDGAQGHYDITPDITTLGKALGAGWPISAIVGRADVMDVLAPGGGVPLSGTYTAHLASVYAANAALEVMAAPGFYAALNARASRLTSELQCLLDKVGVPARLQGIGARFGMYFGTDGPATDLASAARSDGELSRRFVLAALREGLYFADFPGRKVPMHYGIGAAHTDDDLDQALAALARATRSMAT